MILDVTLFVLFFFFCINLGVAWPNAANLHASVCLCLYEHT